MIRFFLPISLFCSTIINAQTDPIPVKPAWNETVLAFVKGHPYETMIEREFFFSDFDLALSDSSYSIVQYLTTWQDIHGNIHAFPVNGTRMTAASESHPLKDLNTTIVFEQILIRKENNYYKIPALIINLTDSVTAESSRKGLAQCIPFILGHPSTNTFDASVFSTDVTLALTDSTYRILDFELVMEDEKERETVFTKLKGPRIPVEKDEVTRLLKRLRPGDMVSLENIRAEKNGNIYEVRSLDIFIK